MANEVSVGYITGYALTFSVYTSAGAEKEAGSALTETPAASGLYLGTPADIDAGDYVVVKESVSGDVIAWGQFQPDVSSTAITADLAGIETKIDTIDTVVDNLFVNGTSQLSVYDSSEPLGKVKIVENL